MNGHVLCGGVVVCVAVWDAGVSEARGLYEKTRYWRSRRQAITLVLGQVDEGVPACLPAGRETGYVCGFVEFWDVVDEEGGVGFGVGREGLGEDVLEVGELGGDLLGEVSEEGRGRGVCWV